MRGNPCPSDSCADGVYPRACGGTPRPARSWSRQSLQGLSPRMRGNHRHKFRWQLARGLSPRMRGNPPRSCVSIPGSPGLSPRMRGNRSEDGVCLAGGLSPRMRGNLTDVGCRSRVYPRACGGTPAWTASPWPAWHGWVYPRACGGTRTSPDRPTCPAKGLSPRMRGNPVGSASWTSPGSIPAHAGEPKASAQARVYPRACGGTTFRSDRSCIDGSIPAHAGEPISASYRDPRACGGTRGRAAP